MSQQSTGFGVATPVPYSPDETKEKVETKDELEMCLINRTLEYFQELQFLHPPVSQTLRNSYLLLVPSTMLIKFN